MKLISFAVVSLLAITVSAHKPKRPFSFKYARQHNQDVVEVKIEKLEEDYRAKQEAILKLEGLKDAEYKERTTKSIMEKLEKELKNDSFPKDKKSYLMRQSNFAFENWKCARDSLIAKQGYLIRAMEECNYAEMKLSILKETLERQPDPDPNDESQDLMGASYDSNLPREILAEQIDEFFQDSADLSAIDEDITSAIDKLNDVKKRAKDRKKKLELIETKNKLMRPSNKLYDEVKFTQLKWTYSKELQAEFGWKPKSSRVSKVFKSSRKGHKMN